MTKDYNIYIYCIQTRFQKVCNRFIGLPNDPTNRRLLNESLKIEAERLSQEFNTNVQPPKINEASFNDI